MRVMSLFAGIGGFDLAAEWIGWRTTVLIEWDIKRQNWLKKLYPHADIFGNIDTFDNRPYRGAIDLICGGEPCQGNSVAGDRLGTKDPRFKWPHFLQQVDEVAPLWVVNENVRGSISNGVLDRKVRDLEAIGYACWPPLLIPASVVGCHHKRERIYLVAYSVRSRRPELKTPSLAERETERVVRHNPECFASSRNVARYANQPELLRSANGLSRGLSPNNRIKAIESFGNAVVPQVIYQIFRAIQQVSNS